MLPSATRRRKLTENKNSLAALVMEPLMQGAAGMWAQPVGYLQALHEICRRNGILLVLDEVATGFGRTGKMFACEHAGVTPDILCLAKGITGGYLPLAATLTSEEVFAGFLGEYKDFKTFFHGHTYTGQPARLRRGTCESRVVPERKDRRKNAAENFVPSQAARRRISPDGACQRCAPVGFHGGH